MFQPVSAFRLPWHRVCFPHDQRMRGVLSQRFPAPAGGFARFSPPKNPPAPLSFPQIRSCGGQPAGGARLGRSRTGSVSGTSRGFAGRGRKTEAGKAFLPGEPLHPDQFSAAESPGQDPDASAGNIEGFRQEPHQRIVRTVLHRGRGQAHPDGISRETGHFLPGRPRQNMHGENGPSPVPALAPGPAHGIRVARSKRVCTRKYFRNRIARIATIGEKSMLPAMTGNRLRRNERTGSVME